MTVSGSRQRPTLRTIADRLGVHVTTVSKVLNGPSGAVGGAASEATAQRIRDVAEELGYRPNPHATSLRTARSNLVGVLVPRLSDIVLATIYEGIEHQANIAGLSTFVTNSHDDPANQAARTSMMLDRRVDGLIFGDARYDAVFLDEFDRQGTPFVLVSRHAADYPSVTCDDYEGGRLAGEHLAGLGHTRVAVVAGEPYASTGIDRTAGFVAAMAARGVEVPKSRVIHAHFDAAGGRSAGDQLLARRHRPTAIFAVNDFAAIGVMGAIRTAGLRVGSDIAVVGYNDTPLAANMTIPLTTVRSPMFDMGRVAIQSLVSLVRGGDFQRQIRLTPELIVRQSSAADVAYPAGPLD